MNSPAQGTRGKARVRPVPEGYQSVTAHLYVKDAAAAIEFYKRALGATEVARLQVPDGRIGHAEIQIGNSRIMLSDEFPDYGGRSPESIGGSPVIMHLFVDDVDALAAQAVTAGAKVLMPVEDRFYGERSGRFADPFGHLWIISTHIEDVPPEEIERRTEAFMKQQVVSALPKEASTKPIKTTPGVREGFHTVTPYITVHQAPELLEFVKKAFGAVEVFRGTGSAGGMHAEVRIGDSMAMIGGGGAWTGTPMITALHLYVPDTDAVYKRAIELGATSLLEPMDQPYGERSAGVKDLAGNFWYVATHLGSTHIPEGLRTINVYLHPHGAAKLIGFLEDAFEAKESARHQTPDGTIQHAQVRIGDSVIEMGEAHGPYQPMPTMFYLYVEDVDALYARAVKVGAISMREPADMPYGDRVGSVKDLHDNVWYIATHIKN
jgi:PhnB protein